MTQYERIKSVFDILETVEMPKELRYNMKEAASTAMRDGANFGGVVVRSIKKPQGKGISTGVLHLWRFNEGGEIIPLQVTIQYTEGDDAE
jgi:hypothetical protein